ncbi:MAG: phosphomannomutase [Bdellovibrionaceae bacterium]|nr:phosphomannomutase [Pseudobdellovibrionaceae bacterium]
MKLNSVIFREYDIRGVYNKDFDLDFAFHLARAHAKFIVQKDPKSSKKVSVGYDARLSSPDIADAIAKGYVASGFQVLELGLITSPISYFSTFYLKDLAGGIMVTGSHNPPEYNGFKISVGAGTIFGENIQDLYKIMEAEDFLSGEGSREHFDIFTPYVEKHKEEFKNLKSIPVVLDCGNGAAGSIVRRLYEACGLKPTILFEEPDGRFPNHHPDPTIEKNLVWLKEAVQKEGALVGLGFDGDADRIGIVDQNGRVVWGDEFIALMTPSVLESSSVKKIVGDVKCSDRMYDFINKAGGEAIMWKTGHSLIKEKIKTEKAPFGGELSGHIFFNDRNFGYDDAIYAGLRLIEVLGQTGKTIPELLKDFPPAFNTPEIRIDTTEEKKHEVVEALKAKFSKSSDEYSVNLIDGIRVSFKDGWALARASNTQPVLVLRFESESEEGLNRMRALFDEVIEPLL